MNFLKKLTQNKIFKSKPFYLLIVSGFLFHKYKSRNLIFLEQTQYKHFDENKAHLKTHITKLKRLFKVLEDLRIANANKEAKIIVDKSYHYYTIDQSIKRIIKELKKISKIFRTFLNETTDIIHDADKLSIQPGMCNDLINLILHIQELKKSRVFTEENHMLSNYIFDEFDDISLRLINDFTVLNKKEKIINEDNLKSITDLCSNLIKIKQKIHNETKLYHAKKILINLNTKQDYYYNDSVIELNHRRNLNSLSYIKNKKVEDDTNFDYDLVFICGLNAQFAKSWRIPYDEKKWNSKHYFDFLLFGRNFEILFKVAKFHLWIPPLLEMDAFKDKNIRYLATNVETKFFKSNLIGANMKDLSLDEISERIYQSLKVAGVGKRPVIFICHSMGGLICKNILLHSHNDNQELVKNTKGVMFFSTPHFGSNVISSILELGFKKYLKLLRQIVFETTSSEFGLYEEDLIYRISEFEFTKATNDVCFRSRSDYEKIHSDFRNFGIPYVCVNESEKTFIKAIGEHVHIVEPSSCHLPETKNYILKGTIHGNLHKFSPEMEKECHREGFRILKEFIKDGFKI